MFLAKDNDDSFVRQHTHHTTGGGGQGVKDLNYMTVMEESKPTKPQGRRRIYLTCQTCRSCCHKVTVTYQNASNCGTLYQHHTIGWRGGGGWPAAPYISPFVPRFTWAVRGFAQVRIQTANPTVQGFQACTPTVVPLRFGIRLKGPGTTQALEKYELLTVYHTKAGAHPRAGPGSWTSQPASPHHKRKEVPEKTGLLLRKLI